jgi:hypothetical protein
MRTTYRYCKLIIKVTLFLHRIWNNREQSMVGMLEWKVSCPLTVTWLGKLEIRFRENAVGIIQGPNFT